MSFRGPVLQTCIAQIPNVRKGERGIAVHHFEYAVKTKATPALAWRVYSDWKMWPTFASIYGDMKWVQGKPWELGSRLEIEVLRPMRIVIDHLITSYEPIHRISWIDRAMGVTIDQQVKFEALPTGHTQVSTAGSIISPEKLLLG